MKLIALTGLHGAGKDTAADALPARKLAFADTLYREVAQAFGETVEWLKDRSRKDVPQDELALTCCLGDLRFVQWTCDSLPGGFSASVARSPRQILQWWGDYRRAQNPDYFITAVESAMLMETAWVITDCRFPNEASMVRQLGGQIWQVVRPGHEPPRTGHASETTGDEFAPDVVLVNDGTLDDLRAKALKEWNK